MREAMSECDDMRGLSRELLDAAAAYRFAPTFEHTSPLERARRPLKAVLALEPQGPM